MEKLIIRIDERYYRPTEVEELFDDPSKAKNKFDWEPKITLEQMIKEMIENDNLLAEKELKQ